MTSISIEVLSPDFMLVYTYYRQLILVEIDRNYNAIRPKIEAEETRGKSGRWLRSELTETRPKMETQWLSLQVSPERKNSPELY